MSEGHVRLLHANNVKIRILLAVSTISIICTLSMGVFALFLYYENKATNPISSDTPDYGALKSKIELNLKVLVNLSETLFSLTRVPESSTSRSTFTVDDSWAVIPSYEWD